jgi:hypothetical protein
VSISNVIVIIRFDKRISRGGSSKRTSKFTDSKPRVSDRKTVRSRIRQE